MKVIGAPLSSLAPSTTGPLADLPARTNDELAEAVRGHRGRLVALATVDAYRGDQAAEEARRAVDELPGLPGLILDAAQVSDCSQTPWLGPRWSSQPSAGYRYSPTPSTRQSWRPGT